MTAKWGDEIIVLSAKGIGWHHVQPDIMDHYFSEGKPEEVIIDLIDFFKESKGKMKSLSDVQINDVYEFIQGSSGPLHLIKDKRISNQLIEKSFYHMSDPFRWHFSSNSYSWTSAWTWWDSFISYSSPFAQDERWEERGCIIQEMRHSAKVISNICESGKRAFEIASQKHPGYMTNL